MDFQFLPKSVTLDDTEGLYVAVSKILHHEFLNEDTHIITGKHASILTVGPISFIRYSRGLRKD